MTIPNDENFVFKVRLNNFCIRNLDLLPFLPQYGSPANIFLRGSFDGKKFVSQSVVPRSCENIELTDLDTKFEYHIKRTMNLAARFVVVEVRMQPVSSKDTILLGAVKVDLHTLSTGPTGQDHCICHHASPSGIVGSLDFQARMEQQTTAIVLLQDIVSGPLPVPFNAYLTMNFSSDTQPDNIGDVLWNTRDPSWRSVPPLYIRCTLREIYENTVIVRMRHCAAMNVAPNPVTDSVIGTFEIPMQKYLRAHTPHSSKFQACLAHTNDQTARFQVPVEGFVEFRGLPAFAQMVSGRNTETGVVGGVPLLCSLPTPLRDISQNGKGAPPSRELATDLPTQNPTPQSPPRYTNASSLGSNRLNFSDTQNLSTSSSKRTGGWGSASVPRAQPRSSSPSKSSPSGPPLGSQHVTPGGYPRASSSPQGDRLTAREGGGFGPPIPSRVHLTPIRRNLVTTPLTPRDLPRHQHQLNNLASGHSDIQNRGRRRSVLVQSRARVEALIAEIRRRRTEIEAEASLAQQRRSEKRVILQRQANALIKQLEVQRRRPSLTQTPPVPPPATESLKDDLMAIVTSGTVGHLRAWIDTHPGYFFPPGEFGPLHCVCRTPRDCTMDLLHLLLVHKLQNVDAVDGKGRTALHYACGRKEPLLEVLHVLWEHGARSDIYDQRGDCPLHVACVNLHDTQHKLKRYLIFRALVPVDQPTKHGETALHLCAVNDMFFDVVVFLVEAGANITSVAPLSRLTPLAIAQANGGNASQNHTYLLKQEPQDTGP